MAFNGDRAICELKDAVWCNSGRSVEVEVAPGEAREDELILTSDDSDGRYKDQCQGEQKEGYMYHARHACCNCMMISKSKRCKKWWLSWTLGGGGCVVFV